MSKIFREWVRPDLEARLSAHGRAWKKFQRADTPCPSELHPFVTISREYGCAGAALAHRLVEMLNERCHPVFPWVAYDHELLNRMSHDPRLYSDVIETLANRRREQMRQLFNTVLSKKADDAPEMRKLAEVVRSLALRGRAVLLGRGSYLITQDLKTGLHVKLVAPVDWRTLRLAATRDRGQSEARKMADEGERRRQRYMNAHFVQHGKKEHVVNPDLLIDNSRFNLAQIAEIVFAALAARFRETLVGK